MCFCFQTIQTRHTKFAIKLSRSITLCLLFQEGSRLRRKLLQILGNCRCNRKETNLSARTTFTKEANGGNRKILSVQPSVFVYLCKSNQSASSRIEQFVQVTKRMFCHRLNFRPVASNNWKAQIPSYLLIP